MELVKRGRPMYRLSGKEIASKFFVLGYGLGYKQGGIGKEILQFIKEGVSGLIFFSRNISDPIQLYTQIKFFWDFAKRPLILAIDQEGGIPRPGFTEGVFPMGIGATRDPSYAKMVGERFGKEAEMVGINTILAPCVDVNTNPENPVIGLRSYSDDPLEVIKFSQSFIEGLRSYNRKVCIKHFPGHGPTREDSHLTLPTVDTKEITLRKIHLLPFKRLIQYGITDMIMTAHVLYPEIDNRPATLSYKFLTKILREELGYKGIVITDCLEMNAMKEGWGIERATVESFKAGADLILISHTPSLQRRAISALEKAIHHGEISTEKIKESLNRIERFLSTLPPLPSNPPIFLPDEKLERDLSKKIVGVKRREKVSITSPNVHLLFSEGVDKKTRFLIEENLGKLYKKIDTYPLYQYKPHKGDEPIFLITFYKTKREGEKKRGVVRDIWEKNKNMIHISLGVPYDVELYDFVPVSIYTYGKGRYQIERVIQIIENIKNERGETH